MTSVFLRLMVRPKALAAPEKQLTIYRSVVSEWARRAKSSANNNAMMSSSVVFVFASSRRRLNKLSLYGSG